jgi:hypothetical protein
MKTRIFLTFILIITSLLTACAIEPEGTTGHSSKTRSEVSPAAGHHNHPMAPLSEMPAEVQAADERTQQAYQFAVANPDDAKQVPCYCGCVGLGHDTSYDCYVAAIGEKGRKEFDLHAVNCTVCVDITLDQMRLIDGGVSPDMIRQVIDKTYSIYGPPTPMLGN